MQIPSSAVITFWLVSMAVVQLMSAGPTVIQKRVR